MNRLKNELETFRTHLNEAPALIKITILLTLLATIIHLILGKPIWVDTAEIESVKNALENGRVVELIYQTLIVAPLIQEFLYRGPIRLFVFLFPKYNDNDKISWVVIAIPTYLWAKPHGDPILIFGIGVIFGWAVLKFRTLESAVLLHSTYNAMILIFGLIKYRFL